jgi:hypothetical protein
MLFPAWRMIGRNGLFHAAPDRWAALSWPSSALLELGFGYGIVPALTFVWMGILVYLLLRRDVLRELSAFRLTWGLLSSLTVLLIATIGLLDHLKDTRMDLHSVTREDFYSTFHLFTVSIPLAASLLAALLVVLPRNFQVGRRRRSVRLWNAGRIRRAVQTFFLALSVCSWAQSVVQSGVQSGAQTPSAETPARQQFAQWLAAFDGSDREAYRQYLQKNFPSGAGRADQDWNVRQNTGGFDLKKIPGGDADKDNGNDAGARLGDVRAAYA